MPLRPYRGWLALIIAFSIGLAATLAAAKYAQDVQHANSAERLERQADMVRSAILNRFHAYQQILLGAAGLFSASDQVSRHEWRAYVASLGVEQHYPGILGIGFAEALTADTLAAHVARIRAEGYYDYFVYPTVSSSPPTAIIYLEPFNKVNRRAFGYNMYSEPTRRAAMERARDTGQPALSGRVALVQDGSNITQAAVLLYMPVYRKAMPTGTVDERRAALLGWIYSPFRIADLMHGIFGDHASDLSLHLFDQTSAGKDMEPLSEPPPSSRSGRQQAPGAHASVSLPFAGREWIAFIGYDTPENSIDLSTPVMILVSGLSLTLLVCALILSLGSSEMRAMGLARDMTAALSTAEHRQRAILQNTADGIVTIDGHGILKSFNAAAEAIFGYRADEVIGRNVSMLMPMRFRAGHDGHVAGIEHNPQQRALGLRREVVGLRRNGEEFPLWLAVNRMPTQEGQEYVGMVSDISERKQAEQQLAASNRLRRSIVESAPMAILSTDLEGIVLSYNTAAEQLFGFTAEEVIGHMAIHQLCHAAQLELRAEGLSRALGHRVSPGFDVLIHDVSHSRTVRDEWSCTHKDGSQLDVESSTSALTDREGSLTGYLFMVHDISERKRAREAIEHMAHHDALTGLPNRVLMQDRLQMAMKRAEREHQALAVLLLDLDHFKRINDSLGHHIGDEMLLAVTQRLRRALRDTDTVARMGGDEFVILLPDVSGADDVSRVVGKLLECLNQPLQLDGHDLVVSASIGICMYPDHGHVAEEVLKFADTAMYRAKGAGRGQYRFFETEMLGQNQRRLETEVALRKALSRNELSLSFQPQVNLDNGMFTGCEALLRWKHPVLGQVSPLHFIPLAEESGLIERMGEWVLHEACQQTRAMQIQLQHPNLLVAVNISPRQFMRGDLRKTLERALQGSGLPAGCLEIEITEGMLLENGERTLDLLHEIRSMGIQVAIDDFGTGYSNLSYIKRFPIDRLKIDRSFVRDIHLDANDAAVVSAIIVMAHTLHLDVVAEGVETPEQMRFLIDRHCNMAQGYLFGAPLPMDALVHHAREHLQWKSTGSVRPAA